jgi:tryptophan synthase alpha chain
MKKLFIPFIMAGDPNMDESIEHLKALQEAGVDKIEIGIPYSDPVADGPVIQRAAKRSIQSGFDLKKFLVKLKDAQINTPLILFTYLNPLFQYGIDNFLKDSKETSFESLLILDLPFKSSSQVKSLLNEYNLSLIPIVTPTTHRTYLREIEESSDSFIYYMMRKGVTGTTKKQNEDEFTSQVKVTSKAPIIAGFGIDGPQKAREVANHFDGVIIGSKIVSLIESEVDIKKRYLLIKQFSQDVIASLDH